MLSKEMSLPQAFNQSSLCQVNNSCLVFVFWEEWNGISQYPSLAKGCNQIFFPLLFQPQGNWLLELFSFGERSENEPLSKWCPPLSNGALAGGKGESFQQHPKSSHSCFGNSVWCFGLWTPTSHLFWPSPKPVFYMLWHGKGLIYHFMIWGSLLLLRKNIMKGTIIQVTLEHCHWR